MLKRSNVRVYGRGVFALHRERSPRIPAWEIAVITLLPERNQRMVCRVADFSTSGMGLNCESSLPVRSAVLIEMEGCILSGEVRYCRELGNEYRVGLQLDQRLAVPENPNTPVRRILKKNQS